MKNSTSKLGVKIEKKTFLIILVSITFLEVFAIIVVFFDNIRVFGNAYVSSKLPESVRVVKLKTTKNRKRQKFLFLSYFFGKYF